MGILATAFWSFVAAIGFTLFLFIVPGVIGAVLGSALSLAQRRRIGVVNAFIAVYSWMFRGLPELIVLLFCYLGLPQIGVTLNPLVAATLGFSLIAVAYQYEIIRAGILAVDRHQFASADALGLPPHRIWWRIIGPQALRIIAPPYLTYMAGALKRTSIASAVAVIELTGLTQRLIIATNRPMELIAIAFVVYFLLSSALLALEHWAAKRLDQYLTAEHGS
jgi:polar amino acid transport system permease protein